jgi:hypothetical protein
MVSTAFFFDRDSSKKVPKNGEHRSNAGPSARAGLFVFTLFPFFGLDFYDGNMSAVFSWDTPGSQHTRSFDNEFSFHIIYDISNTLRHSLPLNSDNFTKQTTIDGLMSLSFFGGKGYSILGNMGNSYGHLGIF